MQWQAAAVVRHRDGLTVAPGRVRDTPHSVVPDEAALRGAAEAGLG